MVWRCGITVGLLFVLVACASAANTYYIATSGSDSACNGKTNAASSAAPNCAFKTFTKSAAVVAAGDTVIATAGTYTEPSSLVTFVTSGTASAYISIKGLPGAVLNSCIDIKGSYYILADLTIAPAVPNGYYAIDLEGAYITVSGITVPKYGATVSQQDTVFGVEGNYITVTDCVVRDLGGIDAFHVFGHDNVIKNNYITNLATVNYSENHVDFIQTWGPKASSIGYNILVSGNVVTNSEIQLGNTEIDKSKFMHDWVFENNVFANVSNPLFWGVPSSTFVNNVFYNVGYEQDDVLSACYSLSIYDGSDYPNYSSKNVSIINNAFISDFNQIHFAGGDPSIFNLFTNNYYSTMAGGKLTGGYYGSAAVNGGNAKFVNAAAYDFHLQAGSVLINAGYNAAAFGFNTDKDGNVRVAPWDIGAYEYVGTSTAAPTTAPTSAPTSTPAPTPKATSAPTPKATSAPTPKATSAPTAAPTTAPTTAPGSISSLYVPYTTVPPDVSDYNGVNVGVKFSANVAGKILGCAVYSRSGGCGSTQYCDLWSATGTHLATTTFSCQHSGAAGWIFANFSTPYSSAASTQYVSSVLFPSGSYSGNDNGFASARTVGHLTVPVSGGVYTYQSTSAFPSQTYEASEYFVSPVFQA